MALKVGADAAGLAGNLVGDEPWALHGFFVSLGCWWVYVGVLS